MFHIKIHSGENAENNCHIAQQALAVGKTELSWLSAIGNNLPCLAQ
ncbi:hypothetical protein BDD43_2466 [Mucilaginibacter gracilis]|uniref:Uncharacterized protein n=1 Tax=Mucilaginibacter gracilis TaxID=423350 RepID=A0A495J000_9SPHI|nr:hypothetical protein BDD43_2466 [Mucilaginibacter gracilis]